MRYFTAHSSGDDEGIFLAMPKRMIRFSFRSGAAAPSRRYLDEQHKIAFFDDFSSSSRRTGKKNGMGGKYI